MKSNYSINIYLVAALFLMLGIASVKAQSSFKDFGYKGGFQINGVLPTTEFESDNGLSLSSYLIRGFFRFELSNDLQTEVGIGYGKLKGDEYDYRLLKTGTNQYGTTIIPIDARLLYTPFNEESWNPYFYAGVGLLNYNVNDIPKVSAFSPSAVNQNGWTVALPLGIGTEIKLSDEVAMDLSVGYKWSLSDNFNYFSIKGTNDGMINVGVGLTFSNESLNTDKDHDGLTKREEMALGTDPDNADTDGDGLKDGEEVNKYFTNPIKVDTDGDGLADGDEVMKYNTNPTKVDTDGDGLSDGDEVLKYKTDPLKTDTDGDGLKDGEEVNTIKTNPLKMDTDGDGLNDGEEVMKYKTDPLKVDTDGGTVGDGVEVKRGTNPLDPKDDVPVVDAEKELTFDFVHFGFNNSNLNKASKKILDDAVMVLSKYSDAKIKLSGHTDSIGSENYNMKLSVKRANVVRDYLVKNGINENQIAAEGFGELKPVAPNKTAKDRAKNRRTEITAKAIEKK